MSIVDVHVCFSKQRYEIEACAVLSAKRTRLRQRIGLASAFNTAGGVP